MHAVLEKHLAFNPVTARLLSMGAGVTIRRYSALDRSADSYNAMLPSLEQFRYEIYIAELQKSLPGADHFRRRLPDEHDATAYHFLAASKRNSIDGCVRLHMTPHVPEQSQRALALDKYLDGYSYPVGYVSKLMVRRSLRGGTTARQLMEAMVEFSRNEYENAEICFFHCNPKLVRLYAYYGFRQFGEAFHDPAVGAQVPMYFMPGDVEHFKSIGSPLYPTAKRRPIPQDLKAYLTSLLHSPGGIA